MEIIEKCNDERVGYIAEAFLPGGEGEAAIFL